MFHRWDSTGFKRTRYEFIERVEVAATALSTSQGCLGLGPTDIVAVLSENCLVIIGFYTILLNQAPIFESHRPLLLGLCQP